MWFRLLGHREQCDIGSDFSSDCGVVLGVGPCVGPGSSRPSPFGTGSPVESWRIDLLALPALLIRGWSSCVNWVRLSSGRDRTPDLAIDAGSPGVPGIARKRVWIWGIDDLGSRGLFITGAPVECGEGGIYLAALILPLASRIVQFNGAANIFQVTQSLKCSSIRETATRLGA